MAEENDSASKTEEPTGRRLEQAREKGDIPKTADLPQITAFAAVAAVIAFSGGLLSHNLLVALAPFIQEPDRIDLSPGGAMAVSWRMAAAVAPVLLVVTGSALLAGVFGHVIQTGPVWSPGGLKFDLSKLSPLSGFRRLFGPDALIQFAKSFIKLVIVAALGFFVLRPHWVALQQLPAVDVLALLPLSLAILKKLPV